MGALVKNGLEKYVLHVLVWAPTYGFLPKLCASRKRDAGH